MKLLKAIVFVAALGIMGAVFVAEAHAGSKEECCKRRVVGEVEVDLVVEPGTTKELIWRETPKGGTPPIAPPPAVNACEAIKGACRDMRGLVCLGALHPDLCDGADYIRCCVGPVVRKSEVERIPGEKVADRGGGPAPGAPPPAAPPASAAQLADMSQRLADFDRRLKLNRRQYTPDQLPGGRRTMDEASPRCILPSGRTLTFSDGDVFDFDAKCREAGGEVRYVNLHARADALETRTAALETKDTAQDDWARDHEKKEHSWWSRNWGWVVLGAAVAATVVAVVVSDSRDNQGPSSAGIAPAPRSLRSP